MGKIHELPKSSSRLMTSAQIISSVYCVVKELIENSLDSFSRNIEVKLEDYGLEKIEVKDNGCGIDQHDLQFVAKPHCTSKIDSYSDLNKVETYGFRGEALGSICAVADLVITTKSAEENFGSFVNFGSDGQVLSCKPCPCAQGTTVAVLNLFKNVPVRRQYYRSDKSKKEVLCKIEDLLISYGCIQTDIRFALYHNKNLIWQKPALTSTRNSLIHILGNSIVDNLKYVEHIDEQNQRKIEAYLPKLEASSTCGLSSSSKCITVINKRPVRIKAIDKLLKDFFNKAIQNSGRARYPICYVSFTIPLTEVDVNVEPNKTTVMLHHSPVAVLQPKVISSKCCLKKTSDQNFDQNVLLDDALQNNYKKIEKDHSNSKKSLEKKHHIAEEKLTPFDMFCNSHSLEVAAENPNYSTQKIAQILFEKWKSLSAEERAVYKNMIVYKDFQRDIKKDRLGKIIGQNLHEDVKNKPSSKDVMVKLKQEVKSKNVPFNIEKIKNYCLTKNRVKSMHEDLSVINYLAPGIWICSQEEKLYLLNTFRLQETIIYHRLLDTYEFDTQPLETPEPLLTSNLGEDAVLILKQLSDSSIDSNGTINDERLIANGFVVKLIIGEKSEISFALISTISSIAFYGVPDLKELLLLITEKGISSKLSSCRPSRIDLFLQSEATRMSKSSPACQRRQDVEDLLNQRSKLPANCSSCIHHKAFFNEIWKL